jgi:hypothetical protein
MHQVPAGPPSRRTITARVAARAGRTADEVANPAPVGTHRSVEPRSEPAAPTIEFQPVVMYATASLAHRPQPR